MNAGVLYTNTGIPRDHFIIKRYNRKKVTNYFIYTLQGAQKKGLSVNRQF